VFARSPGVLRLEPAAISVDACEFQAALDRNNPTTAVTLYRGPFLQGYYEGWVTLRREQYQRRYLDLLRDLGNLYVSLGRNEEAMDAFRSYLIEDPFQESIHVEVMRLYAKQGRRDLVRRQYDQLCRILLEDLGQAPMAGTAKEYHELMG